MVLWKRRGFYPPIFLASFNPQVEYKYDKEMMKGCVIPVSEDMYTQLYKKNAEMASQVGLSLLSWRRFETNGM